MRKLLLRRAHAAALALTALALALAACGGEESTPEGGAGSGGGSAASDAQVALVSTESLKTTSLGRSIVPGLEQIKETYGLDPSISDDIEAADIAPTLRDYAGRGYDLVIANGASMQQPALEVGEQFPETKFVVINGSEAQPPNVAAADFVWEQAGFMAGIVAGVATESDTVAGIGSIHIPPIERLLDGFEQGVKEVNPDAKVVFGYSGSFKDPAVNKQTTLSLIARGADVVFTVATGGDPGVFQATDEKGVLGIGYAVDEASLGPKSVVTSILVEYSRTVFDSMELFDKGTLEPKVYYYGFKDEAFALAPFKHLPEDQVAEIEESVKKAMDGGFDIEIAGPTD